jgi:hypothetical protein
MLEGASVITQDRGFNEMPSPAGQSPVSRFRLVLLGTREFDHRSGENVERFFDFAELEAVSELLQGIRPTSPWLRMSG